jgi:FHS family glucose/mannose:H+ symporter-like MFS transporter
MARSGLAGFLLSGILMSFLGAILPAWGYHLHNNALLVGGYFLAQTCGLLIPLALGGRLLRRKGLSFGLALACGLACAGLLELALFSPPSHYAWRLGGLVLTGAGAGLLNMALFHAISPAYEIDPAATINLGGTLFGLGCLLTALLVAATFYLFSVWVILVLVALPAGAACAYYARRRMPDDPMFPQPTWREALEDFKSPVAILFTLLLFFQFGNEWALAGWLPLFVSQRLGTSPSTSLLLLALYWLALMLGRFLTQFLLSRVTHTRLLLGAVLAPLFACSVLAFTDNLFGMVTAILFAGGGFAVIYPLVVEKIGSRFSYFHPGFYSGIFSIGIIGGLLSPATLGLYAHFWGVGVVAAVPLLGTIMVFLLLLLILLESRLSGHPGT